MPGSYEQVDVIRHKNISVNLAVVFSRCLTQGVQVERVVNRPEKYGLLVDTA